MFRAPILPLVVVAAMGCDSVLDIQTHELSEGGSCTFDTPVCTTMHTGGIPLTCGYQATLGQGYSYTYTDMHGSEACQDIQALCAAISVQEVPDAAYLGTEWGAGVGFNLAQGMDGSPPGQYPVPSGATGLTYSVTGLPPPPDTGYGGGLRIDIDDDGTEYCTILSEATGNVLWSAFNTQCWSGGMGTALSGPPHSIGYVNFQLATSQTQAGTFDFCVQSIAFSH
jgi:hypothetical protein